MISEIVLRDRQHAKIWIYNITTSNGTRDCYHGYKFYLVFYPYTDFYQTLTEGSTLGEILSSINANIRWKCMKV